MRFRDARSWISLRFGWSQGMWRPVRGDFERCFKAYREVLRVRFCAFASEET
jgi:hypothetical protein